jgi:hypothetical protein
MASKTARIKAVTGAVGSSSGYWLTQASSLRLRTRAWPGLRITASIYAIKGV